MADLSVVARRRTLRLPLDVLLLWVYLALLIFDFRRAEGDSSSLVVVLGLGHLGLGVLLLVQAGKISRRSIQWMVPMMLFALASAVTGILREQPVYSVLSHLVPLLIFIVAVLVVSNLHNKVGRLLLPSIAFFALLSTAWKLGFGFTYTGLDLETIRYQIISGALPLLFAYGTTGLLVERRKWTAIAIGLSILVVVLSVTRTYIVVFAVTTCAAILAMPLSALGKATRRGLILAFLGVAALIVVGLVFPEAIERWTSRMGSSERFGFDLTGATRLAEAAYQFQKMGEDTLGLFFGFGQGTETRFGGSAAQLVQSVLGNRTFEWRGHGYGHISYVGLVYVGGLVFGLPVIGVFILLLSRAILISRQAWQKMTVETRFTTIWGISSYAGYLSYGAFGAPWGDRTFSLYFGISVALILLGLRQIKTEK